MAVQKALQTCQRLSKREKHLKYPGFIVNCIPKKERSMCHPISNPFCWESVASQAVSQVITQGYSNSVVTPTPHLFKVQNVIWIVLCIEPNLEDDGGLLKKTHTHTHIFGNAVVPRTRLHYVHLIYFMVHCDPVLQFCFMFLLRPDIPQEGVPC